MVYDFLNQPTLASLVCFRKDGDPFYNPGSTGFTGFAADGYAYVAGVKNLGSIASWCSEPQSATRGPLASFPIQALVVVSRASLAIMDATQQSLPLWMLFYLADNYAYTVNPLNQQAGFLASVVSWNNGLLTISMTPDAGAASSAPLVLTFDFTQDKIYADSRV